PAESVTLSGITNPVKEGETKTLTCTTSTSNPASQISWLKDNNVWTANTYESITSNVTRDGDYNGKISEQQMTISIQAEHNSKSYHCQSSHIDFTGHVISTVIHLTVYYKPYFVNVSKNQRFYASKGSVAELRCEIESNPLSSVIWYGPNNQPINIDNRISINTVSRGTLYESILTIQNTMLSDYGNYSCFAENDIGNTTFIVTFKDKSVPDAPKSVVPITRFYDSLVVTIIPGYDGGDADTTYFIQYRTRRNATFIELNADNSETTNITIEILELYPSTLYECRAYAANAIGLGPYSNAIIIRTLDEPIVELDHDTTTLSWTRHENETYTCVKIETRHVDVTWDVIVKCIDRNILEYKVNDTNREYRITYCTADGFCESRDFSAFTRRTSN
uniref:Peroxidasin-like n=1 Tax=Saccoglossus kowalevskii TaxID=10224 RepID=A0ABM0MT22_SACKO